MSTEIQAGQNTFEWKEILPLVGIEIAGLFFVGSFLAISFGYGTYYNPWPTPDSIHILGLKLLVVGGVGLGCSTIAGIASAILSFTEDDKKNIPMDLFENHEKTPNDLTSTTTSSDSDNENMSLVDLDSDGISFEQEYLGYELV